MAESAPSRIRTDEACDAAIARLGALDRELAAIEAAKAAAVAAASTAAESAATPLQDERSSLAASVEAWCAAERTRLTDAGKTKTVEFKAGTVAWRLGRKRVEIDETLTTAEKIVAKLKELRLTRMIRVKEEPNKTAILNEPDKVKGIRGLRIIEGVETFSIEPVSATLAATPAAA